MEAQHKKVLKSISLLLRHLLEGSYDSSGQWHPGDLEQRLAGIGVRRDREPVGVDELSHLPPADQKARQVVDAYLQLRAVERNSFRSSAGEQDSLRSGRDSAAPPNGMNSVLREEAVAEFVRETAYTWANRLLALRCMEARELIDEVILQKAAYGGRSLEHHRLAQRQPELCTGEDDGLLAVLDQVFAEQTRHLPMLFDPESPGVALRPSAAAIKRCVTLLSESQKVGDQTIDTTEVFRTPDAFGWAYQYWNTEEKDRVFENVRTKKGAKIEGADIIPATQLYTEPYMVKFLVQNSLGATWMGMHPESQLPSPSGRGAGGEGWEYYVRDADRAPVETKAVAEITFLDPACGSGHFLIEAFDLFYEMYEEEGLLTDPDAICRSILENNLYGIDIDARAVQIAEVALWMKAAERTFGFEGKPANLVAAVTSHLKGPLWKEFLAGFEQEPSIGRVLRRFGQAMEHIDQLGSLARPDEELREIVREEHDLWERQIRVRREANFLFSEMTADALSGQLPFREMTDEEFGEQMLDRARAAIHAFSEQARQAGTFQDQFLGYEATEGFRLLQTLSKRYDVVAANPPYASFRNLGDLLSGLLRAGYPSAPTDTYAAMLWRSLDLLCAGGRVAFVTQDGLLLLPSLDQLRDRILSSYHLDVVVHLGPHAFQDISGEKVSVALTIVHSSTPTRPTRWFSLVNDTNKATTLASCASEGYHAIANGLSQADYRRLDRKQWLYFVPRQLLDILANKQTLERVALVKQGIITGANSRYVRYWWEIRDIGRRWKWYFFGSDDVLLGAAGIPIHVIDWREGATWRFVRPRAPELHFKEGITFGRLGTKFLCTPLPKTALFDVNSSAAIFFADEHRSDIFAYVSAPLVAALLQALNVSLTFLIGDVANLPLPETLPKEARDRLTTLGEQLLTCRARAACSFPVTPLFRTSSETEYEGTRMDEQVLLRAIDEDVRGVLGLDYHDTEILRLVADVVVTEDQDEVATGNETADGIAVQSANRLVSIIASIGGFTWYENPSRRFPISSSSDLDGIIPLTDGTQEPTLFERIRLTSAAGSSASKVDREPETLNGKPLAEWITMAFFDQHVRQFKRRPIIWHVQSSRFTPRQRPAFACLVYYHKLDADLLEKIRTQYAGPLRQRFDTELRGIESVARAARSDRQTARSAQLADLIKELQEFDARLQAVQASAFCDSQLRQYAIQDALLCMKAYWLRRLSETIQAGPLPKWTTEASRAEIDAELPDWIDFAMHDMDYFCSQVGPKQWESMDDDPTSRTLAAMICSDCERMVIASLRLANRRWQDRVNEVVIKPLREELSQKREALNAVDEELEQLSRHECESKFRLKDEEDRLKSEIKVLNQEIDRIKGRVERLRATIEDWKCHEVAGWEPWLAEQPMYDPISSVDGRRRPPTTVVEWVAQEQAYHPDINDGVRVNIAPLQKAGLLAADVLAKKDLDKAIADRAQWRADERRWCREGKLPQPGWWPEGEG